MPTPFYHLSIAQELMGEERLSENVRSFLQSQQNAFYLGNTAPDVQSLMDIPRDGTHFFKVPPKANVVPWEKLFRQNPGLGDSAGLPSAHAAFIAGYICHLQADIFWIHEIFLPIFGLAPKWGRFRQRLFYHNILRTYLDYEVIAALPEGIAGILASAKPENWLDFVPDENLVMWREMLTRQLHPGAEIETVAVFAERQGISAEDYNAIVNSETEMEEKIFVHISRQELIEYRSKLIQENVRLLSDYLEVIANK